MGFEPNSPPKRPRPRAAGRGAGAGCPSLGCWVVPDCALPAGCWAAFLPPPIGKRRSFLLRGSLTVVRVTMA